jgi:ParB-like chromosome segregation protein Spo0J
VKTLVRQGQLSARTAIALKPLPPRQQVTMAERAVTEGLTAEQIREEVRRNANVGSTRTTAASTLSRPATSLPIRPQKEEAERPGATGSGSRPAREGTITHTLESFIEGLDAMSEWLDGHKWPPSSLTPNQQDLIHRLYHVASQFQQRVAYIRHPLKEMTSLAGRDEKNILPF